MIIITLIMNDQCLAFKYLLKPFQSFFFLKNLCCVLSEFSGLDKEIIPFLGSNRDLNELEL